MSYSAYIGIKKLDGTVDAILNIGEGYPKECGKKLLQYYRSPKRVKDLISQGQIRHLGKYLHYKFDCNDKVADDNYDITYICMRDERNWKEKEPEIFSYNNLTSFKEDFFNVSEKNWITITGYLFDEETRQWFFTPGSKEEDFVPLNAENYAKVGGDDYYDETKREYESFTSNLIPEELMEKIDVQHRTESVEDYLLRYYLSKTLTEDESFTAESHENNFHLK